MYRAREFHWEVQLNRVEWIYWRSLRVLNLPRLEAGWRFAIYVNDCKCIIYIYIYPYCNSFHILYRCTHFWKMLGGMEWKHVAQHIFLLSRVSIQQESVDTSMVSKSTPRPSVTSGNPCDFSSAFVAYESSIHPIHPLIKKSSSVLHSSSQNYRVVKGGVPRRGGSLIFPEVPQSYP